MRSKWILLSCLIGSVVFAHGGYSATLLIRLSPVTVAPTVIERGSDSYETLGALRATASGGPVDLQGLTLTTTGTGDWATGTHANDGITLTLDDGDGVPGPGDTLVWQGDADSPSVSGVFAQPVVIGSGESVDLWVSLHRTASAGSLLGDSFIVALTSATHVTCTAAVVRVTPQILALPELRIAEFHVSDVYPLEGWTGVGLTVIGFGFKLPVAMTIGRYPCDGTPTISPDGTQLTGLYPVGLPFYDEPKLWPDQRMILSSGPVVDYELPIRFTFRWTPSIGRTGTDNPFSIGGHVCVATTGSTISYALIAAFLGGVVLSRWPRRRIPGRGTSTQH